MTDQQLAAALGHVTVLEELARQHWQAAAGHEERDAALEVVRQTTAVQRLLQKWITARARRAVA